MKEGCQTTTTTCPLGHGSGGELNNDNNTSPNRITSSIPQKDKVGNWVYPSPQMFYNAMTKKGHNPDPFEMELLVNIHNVVNEKCWRYVLEWEKRFHKDECPEGPKLIRFRGRPEDLSPRAWIRHYIMGYAKPFDRHDWIIDRCGKEVRYVLDFYGAQSDTTPMAIHLDVRPALDTPTAIWDRIKKFVGV